MGLCHIGVSEEALLRAAREVEFTGVDAGLHAVHVADLDRPVVIDVDLGQELCSSTSLSSKKGAVYHAVLRPVQGLPVVEPLGGQGLLHDGVVGDGAGEEEVLMLRLVPLDEGDGGGDLHILRCHRHHELQGPRSMPRCRKEQGGGGMRDRKGAPLGVGLVLALVEPREGDVAVDAELGLGAALECVLGVGAEPVEPGAGGVGLAVHHGGRIALQPPPHSRPRPMLCSG